MAKINSPQEYRNRLAFLQKTNRRCHGNKGMCTHAAVREAEVYPVNFEGERIGENLTLKMCGKASHCRPYLNSSSYVVLWQKDISRPQPQHQKAG
jgi:hypothetical protein